MRIFNSVRIAESWHVFAPVPPATELPFAGLSAIPEMLELEGRHWQGNHIHVPTGRLNLAFLADEKVQAACALILIPLTMEADGEAWFGLGADWWLEAWIDGRPLFDTLATGNESRPVSFDHVVPAMLTAGPHLLAVRVRRGADGFVLCAKAGVREEFEPIRRAANDHGTEVDFATDPGTIRPLHGVNNGPITFGSLIDVSGYYRDLRVPWVRIHDPDWPHPREVDIPQILRDEDSDQASGDFSRTDMYIRSTLIRLQDAGVDIASNYDGQPTNFLCGLFDQFGAPQKTFLAFLAFRELLDCSRRVRTCGSGTVDALAAMDAEGKRATVLLAKHGGGWHIHRLELGNLPNPFNRYEVRVLDRDQNLETVDEGVLDRDQPIYIFLRDYAVALVTLWHASRSGGTARKASFPPTMLATEDRP